MRKKKPKPFYVYLVPAIRKIWQWSEIRRDAIKKASEATPDFVRCALCGELKIKASYTHPGKKKKTKDYSVDHIEPVGPAPKGFVGWDGYLKRMLNPDKGVQVLCTECHQKKTNKETKRRIKNNKK